VGRRRHQTFGHSIETLLNQPSPSPPPEIDSARPHGHQRRQQGPLHSIAVQRDLSSQEACATLYSQSLGAPLMPTSSGGCSGTAAVPCGSPEPSDLVALARSCGARHISLRACPPSYGGLCHPRGQGYASLAHPASLSGPNGFHPAIAPFPAVLHRAPFSTPCYQPYPGMNCLPSIACALLTVKCESCSILVLTIC
jgi:hypothetical protein